jgi:hypothetical protein
MFGSTGPDGGDWDYFGRSIWSPDASQIAFQTTNGGDGCAGWWTVPADGAAAPVQVPLPTCAQAVAWRAAS